MPAIRLPSWVWCVLITPTSVPDGCAAGVLDVGVAGEEGVAAVFTGATVPAALGELLPHAVTAMAVASVATIVIADRVMWCMRRAPDSGHWARYEGVLPGVTPTPAPAHRVGGHAGESRRSAPRPLGDDWIRQSTGHG